MPNSADSLRAVLAYYGATMKVSAEGDVHMTDESGQGIGNASFFSSAFGAVSPLLASRHSPTRRPPLGVQMGPATSKHASPVATLQATFPWDPGDLSTEHCLQEQGKRHNQEEPGWYGLLTRHLPDPGYFLAGAIAGAVSRTVTAPFDRLKVYLIAQTNNTKPLRALTLKGTEKASRPLFDAIRNLWLMGGIKSLFAGESVGHFSFYHHQYHDDSSQPCRSSISKYICEIPNLSDCL